MLPPLSFFPTNPPQPLSVRPIPELRYTLTSFLVFTLESFIIALLIPANPPGECPKQVYRKEERKNADLSEGYKNLARANLLKA